MFTPTDTTTVLDYKAFYQKLETDQIQTFHATGFDVDGLLIGGRSYRTGIPNRDTPLVNEVRRHVKGTVIFESSTGNPLLGTLLTLLPFVLTAILFFLIFRSSQLRPPPR